MKPSNSEKQFLPSCQIDSAVFGMNTYAASVLQLSSLAERKSLKVQNSLEVAFGENSRRMSCVCILDLNITRF